MGCALMSKDIIIGLHSVYHALKNPNRRGKRVLCTDEGFKELKKKYNDVSSFLNDIELKKLSNHDFQQESKSIYQKSDLQYSRIPSGVLLESDELQTYDVPWLYEKIESKDPLKILCLDQVTDIHNGAAIFRTAAFYGVDIILLPVKGSFRFTPSFYRISSGSVEHVKIVRGQNFVKMINKLQEKKVHVFGLSEHAEEHLTKETIMGLEGHKCLVLGAEEKGISHAILRIIQHKLALESHGEIKSLNVSVASALAMERTFG
jgi:23S rRNA (guanosine2251-2'-O)-methyltransferase